MKKSFLFAFALSMLFSCGNKEQNVKEEPYEIVEESETEPELSPEEIETKTKVAVEKYKSLYEDLKKMRYNSAFHYHEFGVNSPARGWLRQVEQLEEEYGDVLFENRSLIPRDLIMLAIEWGDNKGKSTDVSKSIQKDIENNLKNGK